MGAAAEAATSTSPAPQRAVRTPTGSCALKRHDNTDDIGVPTPPDRWVNSTATAKALTLFVDSLNFPNFPNVPEAPDGDGVQARHDKFFPAAQKWFKAASCGRMDAWTHGRMDVRTHGPPSRAGHAVSAHAQALERVRHQARRLRCTTGNAPNTPNARAQTTMDVNRGPSARAPPSEGRRPPRYGQSEQKRN